MRRKTTLSAADCGFVRTCTSADEMRRKQLRNERAHIASMLQAGHHHSTGGANGRPQAIPPSVHILVANRSGDVKKELKAEVARSSAARIPNDGALRLSAIKLAAAKEHGKGASAQSDRGRRLSHRVQDDDHTARHYYTPRRPQRRPQR